MKNSPTGALASQRTPSHPERHPRGRRGGSTRQRLCQLALCLGAVGLASCAPSAAPAAAPTAVPAAPAAAEPELTDAPEVPPEAPPTTTSGSGAIDLDGEDDLDKDIAELSQATQGANATKENDRGGREVVYRVTPQGLVIEVNGIHLRPSVKVARDARGAYTLELTLTAESFDGRQYWLSQPAEGPFSIAGKIESKAGKPQRFGDERTGATREEVVTSAEPRRFKQRWPGKGQPQLRSGQTLTLEVGLWGVRSDSEQPRAVRRLFEVKLLATSHPDPAITPPTLDWGN